MQPTSARHTPVLLRRCIELLTAAESPKPQIYVDATLGMGGHSEGLLQADPTAMVIGIDRDLQAIDLASKRLASFGERFVAAHAVFDQLPQVLQELGHTEVSGVLMDLGVSSLQLDEAERGFSYAQDAALDMRMDQSQGISAAEILNEYSATELARILWKYGEEKFSRSIANRIVQRRVNQPLTTTGQLVDIIRQSIPAAARKSGGNPAKRTFQALRIEVNQELAAIENAIPQALAALAPGGRLVVMAYQSLEDRIVKNYFRDVTSHSAPAGLPVIPQDAQPRFTLLTKGAERASAQEQEDNPRATPVRLRAVAKNLDTPRSIK